MGTQGDTPSLVLAIGPLGARDLFPLAVETFPERGRSSCWLTGSQNVSGPVPIIPSLLPRVAFAVSSSPLGRTLTTQQRSQKTVSAEGRPDNPPIPQVLSFLFIYF